MSMVLWEERREYRDGRLVVMSSEIDMMELDRGCF